MMIKLVVFIAVLIGISVFGMRGYRNAVKRFEAEQARLANAPDSVSDAQADHDATRAR